MFPITFNKVYVYLMHVLRAYLSVYSILVYPTYQIDKTYPKPPPYTNIIIQHCGIPLGLWLIIFETNSGNKYVILAVGIGRWKIQINALLHEDLHRSKLFVLVLSDNTLIRRNDIGPGKKCINESRVSLNIRTIKTIYDKLEHVHYIFPWLDIRADGIVKSDVKT